MTLFLSDPEARSFATGGRVLWRETGYDLTLSKGFHWEVDEAGLWGVENEPIRFPDAGPEIQPSGIYVPIKPGDHLDLKETWAWFGSEYIYKADIDEHSTVFARQGTKMYFPQWRSPVTMPRAAVRWHMTVVSVEVVERDGKWGWALTLIGPKGKVR